MTILAPTFDFMQVSAANDGEINHYLSEGNGISYQYGNDLKVTTTGLEATVDTGSAMIFGRLIKIIEKERVSLPANTSGYIVITIDLTKINSFEGTPGDDNYKPKNNQVRLETTTKLVQQDLISEGSIYQFPIYQFTTDGNIVTNGQVPYGYNSRPNRPKELAKGSYSINSIMRLPDEHKRYSCLDVGVNYFGNYILVRLHKNDDGTYNETGTSMINLGNGPTDKTYSFAEVTVAYKSGGVVITSLKELAGNGTLSIDRTVAQIIRCVGLY